MISIEALPKIIDSTQLTSDLDGTLSYDHANWLETRLAVEEFAWQAADLLDRLDDLQVSYFLLMKVFSLSFFYRILNIILRFAYISILNLNI